MEDKYAAQPEQEIAPKTPDADDVDALFAGCKKACSANRTARLRSSLPPETSPCRKTPAVSR